METLQTSSLVPNQPEGSAAQGMINGQNPHQPMEKSPKTPILIVVIVVLFLALAGAITWGVIASQQNQTPQDTTQDGNQDDSQGISGEDNSPKELALDNVIVQRLYHNFDAVTGSVYNGASNFYTSEGALGVEPNKELMLAIATRAISAVNDSCNGRYKDEISGSPIYRDCRQGNDVRRKVKEIFGKDIVIEDGELAGNVCGTWKYNAENDEFYIPSTGCGGTCFTVQNRTLDKAEQVGDHIYLYETVYGENCQSLFHANGDEIVSIELDESGNMIGEKYNIDDYKGQFDHFKWTFTKNSDGDYSFTGLEKI